MAPEKDTNSPSGTSATDQADSDQSRASDKPSATQLFREGVAAQKAGDTATAVAMFREALKLNPSDPGGWAVRLAALGAAQDPKSASPAYMRNLFDQIASDFDDRLVRRLGYGVPDKLAMALSKIRSNGFKRCIDLGCGTGLVGLALKGQVQVLHGVDLSEGMLQQAWERKIYQKLFVGDVTRFLELAEENDYDLITAADVFPYIGAPEQLFAAAARVLAPDGLFAFSTETLDAEAFKGRSWRVNQSRRFAHNSDWLVITLRDVGFEPLLVEPITVRKEAGTPVPGHLIVVRLTK